MKHDLFRCEFILLGSYWVMVVLNVFTRRLIGFGVEPGPIAGHSACRMFNRAIAGTRSPRRGSTDHDPLFRFHRWLANLRVLEIEEIKTVPYAPVSHRFVERLIGTVRREYLDQVFSGKPQTWHANWANSRIITTGIAYTAASLAPRPHNSPERPPPLRRHSIATLGDNIAGGCFRLQSPLDYEFATHRHPWPRDDP